MKKILQFLRSLLRPFPHDMQKLLESSPWLLNTPGGKSVWQEGK